MSDNIGKTLLSELSEYEHLEHFGVKGMRWGVRHNDDGTVTRSGRKAKGSADDGPQSDDFKSFASAKSKVATSGTKSLSNAELQSMVTRMNLEQQYSRLSPVPVSRGKKFLGGVGKASTEIVANTTKSIVAEQLKKALTKGITKAATAAVKK